MKPFNIRLITQDSVVTTRLGTRCKILDVTGDSIVVSLANSQVQTYNIDGRLHPDRDSLMDLVIQ